MKRSLTFTSLALAAALTGLPRFALAHDHEDHDHEMHEGKASADTVTGEVVDLACYMAHDGKGKDHMKCAKQCIQKGLPVGLLTEKGEVYLAVGSHHEKANKLLADYASKTITVVGEVSEKGGSKMVTIENIVKK